MVEQGLFTLTMDDVVAADRLYSKSSFSWKRVSVILFGIVSAWFLWLWLFYPWVGLEVYAIVAASLISIFCLIWLVGWLLVTPMAKRKWKRFKSLWVETRVRCTPDEIEFKWDKGEVRSNWSDFNRWAIDERILLLYRSRDDYTAIPLAAFRPGAAETMTGYLKAAGVPKR
jgi:hypothetical protein